MVFGLKLIWRHLSIGVITGRVESCSAGFASPALWSQIPQILPVGTQTKWNKQLSSPIWSIALYHYHNHYRPLEPRHHRVRSHNIFNQWSAQGAAVNALLENLALLRPQSSSSSEMPRHHVWFLRCSFGAYPKCLQHPKRKDFLKPSSRGRARSIGSFWCIYILLYQHMYI